MLPHTYTHTHTHTRSKKELVKKNYILDETAIQLTIYNNNNNIQRLRTGDRNEILFHSFRHSTNRFLSGFFFSIFLSSFFSSFNIRRGSCSAIYSAARNIILYCCYSASFTIIHNTRVCELYFFFSFFKLYSKILAIRFCVL